MKFSIILVCDTTNHDLTRALHSIAAQTQRDFEVLVCGYNGTLPDERFRAIDADTSNPTTAKNQAATQAQGEWLLFMNPTSVLEEECIARLYAATLRFPRCSIFTPTLLDNAAPEMLAAAGISYFFSGFPFSGGKDWPLDVLPDEGECFAASSHALLITKTAFESAGGFDADFAGADEDTDICFRLRLMGHHVMLASEAIVFISQTGRSDEPMLAARNTVCIFIKNMPDVLFHMLLPLHLLFHISCLCNPLQFKSRVSGLVAAFKDPATLWQKRKTVQVMRTVHLDTIARSFTWNINRLFWHRPDIRRRR